MMANCKRQMKILKNSRMYVFRAFVEWMGARSANFFFENCQISRKKNGKVVFKNQKINDTWEAFSRGYDYGYDYGHAAAEPPSEW